MTSLRIDPASRTIEAELLLAGEKEPIRNVARGYELTPAGEFRLGDITISRAWLDTLARDLIAKRPLQVPPEVTKWLKLIV